MKNLLLASAALELPAGLCLLIAPSRLAALLLGVPLDSMVALLMARIAGAALLALCVASWLVRSSPSARAVWGIVAALLVYNLGVVAILIHARFGPGLSGAGLWPAVAGHLCLSAWCVAGLCNRPS